MATVAQTSATQAGSEQAATKDTIRPFHVNVPEAELTELRRRIRGDTVARPRNGRGSVAGRAARDDAETRPLLGDRIRLAQGRGEAEGAAAIHHRDRWTRHSFHSRAFEA